MSVPLTGPYDLIVSHFFLDCFTTEQIEELVDRLLQICSGSLLDRFRISNTGNWIRASRGHRDGGLFIPRVPLAYGIAGETPLRLSPCASAGRLQTVPAAKGLGRIAGVGALAIQASAFIKTADVLVCA